MKLVLFGRSGDLIPLLNRYPVVPREIVAVPEAADLAGRRSLGLDLKPRIVEPGKDPESAMEFWSRVLEGEVMVLVSDLRGNGVLILSSMLARRAEGSLILPSGEAIPVGVFGRLARLCLGKSLRPPYGRRKRKILRAAGLIRGRNLDPTPVFRLVA